ncbi:TPA: HK97 gp10 family phage protein [Citrobacter amalonaticus]|nr:HK97 gp10 family phage protein [Citrobacter amalonaticus]
MIKMEITGLDELEKQLVALGEKAGTNLLREAGKAAMSPVEEDMKHHAGYDESNTGTHMRDSIKIRTRKGGKKFASTVISIRVGPGNEHYMKAAPQEFGTVKQIARPFIRPALDYNKTEVLRILSVEIKDRLQNR